MIELLIAFGAGLISFLSPCVLPLIPGYVSFISGQSLQEILKSKKIQSIWGELEGSELKTAPRNFDKNHPDIDLIRKKQFIFKINYSDKEVLDKKFIIKIENSLKAIRPFLNYMTDILTSDENGESLI